MNAFARARDWRRIVASLALVIFTIANFATQTHVHLHGSRTASDRVSAITTGFAFERTPAPGKTNPFDNPATCPLCQDIALFGHFTTPAVIPVLPPALIALGLTVIAPVRLHVDAVSHIWRGRSPPRH